MTEEERLKEFLVAIHEHHATVWGNTAAGRGSGIGGQTMTTTAHPEVVMALTWHALNGDTLKKAADEYAALFPGSSRLDERAKRPYRAGPDGRPV